jgi:murein DD-endopeptidase MepM/ murein hydrolase activator NlpD
MVWVALLVFGLFLIGESSFGLRNQGEKGIWGGPVRISSAQAPSGLSQETGLLAGNPSVAGPDVELDLTDPLPSPDLLAQGSIRGGSGPYDTAMGGTLLIYKVQPGDSLGKIAANFGISVETLINSNPGVNKLKAGQELSVLPVSGVLYALKAGETAAGAAGSFGLSAGALRQYNPTLANASPGDKLVIPGASLSEGQNDAPAGKLPDLRGYFIRPTTGFNWGKLHAHNGVDVANVCGTPIVASAEGLVIAAEADGWNGGYGSYVLIEHPNGTKTKYAHLSKVSTEVGDYVDQGKNIGLMGRSGDSTGCHLHFEVEGARNIMAK